MDHGLGLECPTEVHDLTTCLQMSRFGGKVIERRSGQGWVTAEFIAYWLFRSRHSRRKQATGDGAWTDSLSCLLVSFPSSSSSSSFSSSTPLSPSHGAINSVGLFFIFPNHVFSHSPGNTKPADHGLKPLKLRTKINLLSLTIFSQVYWLIEQI